MPSRDPISIAFLLGAGVSIPAGMPSTSDITERVLSGEGIMWHTNGNYYIGPPLYAHAGIPDEFVPRVVRFLSMLRKEIDLYYQHRAKCSTNYEDLYYVASQIHDSETGEYDNPGVQPLIDKILHENPSLLVGEEDEVRQEWRLLELASEAIHYITDVVWRLLAEEPNRLDHLDSLKEACLDNQLSRVDIFTLNHDTVLEQCLSQNGIRVTDGFGKPTNEVRYWDPTLFESGSPKVRLLKLHGSINWFRLVSDTGDRSYESIGIPLHWDFWHTKDPQGYKQRPVDRRPMLLAGTFNKTLEYTGGVYADLHCQFHRSLRNARRLVICGYSFGEKAINRRLGEWIDSRPDHRIAIVHPRPDSLKRHARGEISKDWERLKDHRKLVIIPKGVEETCWQEIKCSLFSAGA